LIIWGWGAIESDFQRFYNIDINEACFNDSITWRKFKTLLKHLPPESAWGYFLADKDKRRWADNPDFDIRNIKIKKRGN
jgi:hypothetical protein